MNETPSQNPNNPLFAYPLKQFLRDFVSTCENRKWALGELIEIYESKTKRKLSRRAYQIAIKKEEGSLFRIERHEQFFIYPLTTLSEMKRNESEKKFIDNLTMRKVRIHSSHKWKFGVDYQGTPPIDGKVSYYGKQATLKRYFYRISDRISIVAFKKRLNVWVHRPSGTTTQEQETDARTLGINALTEFAQAHGLTITSDLSKVLLSHHIIEARQVEALFKPIYKLYGEDIYQKIGSRINHSSHKDKIEHVGIRREDRLILGSKVATGMEYWLYDLPNEIKELKTTETERKEALVLLARYTEQIKAHLSAVQGIEKSNKELVNTMQEIRDWIKRGN